ncbi:MAG: glycosyltransferase [Pirellulaceae bacterium]|nr:glycosyltransferase [Pirellulaceae bacterium]
MSESQHPVAPRVLVLLCTYDEIANLPMMVSQLHQALPQADILVVDDNSPDGTGRWVQQQMATDRQLFLLSRSGKLGLGSATRVGIQWGLEHEYDYLINLDADQSHRPSDAPALLMACRGLQGGVSVGSRYLPGGGFIGVAWHRRWMSRQINRYAGSRLKLPLTDCSGSFRCYSAAALRQVNLQQLTCNGYGFLEEILVALHRSGCPLAQVPILFQPRTAGRSKLSLQDAWGAIQVIRRLAQR